MNIKYNLKLIIYKIIKLIYKLLFIFPLNANKIIINSYDSMGYYDNPKYITDELLKIKDFTVYCITKNNEIPLPPYIKRVKKNSFFYFYHYATAKLAINNTRFPLYIAKRKNQYFVETWHGIVPGKRVGLSMQGLTPVGKALVLNDAKVSDLFISGSRFLTDVYRTDFQYNGDVIEVGYPRADIVFSDMDTDKLYEELGIDKDSKICMYAPTFRDNGNTDVYDIDYERLKQALEKKYNSKWTILVRFHPNISEYASTLNYSDWLINITNFPSLYSLYKITDIMITDYSSAGFEFFVYTGKPLLLYAKDSDSYQKNRDTYIDIKDYPFKIAKNNDELIDIISSENIMKKEANSFAQKTGAFCNKNSAKEIAEYIVKKAYKKEEFK